jgi:hypothetical protein
LQDIIWQRQNAPISKKNTDYRALPNSILKFKGNKWKFDGRVLTWISKNFSARTGGPLSMGYPEPLKTLPSISTLIGMRSTSPVNSHVVVRLSIPAVPSKIYIKFQFNHKNQKNKINYKNLPALRLFCHRFLALNLFLSFHFQVEH